MAESEQQSACSEDNSSVCDEERARKLFQACDGDGDGFIDSNDLLYICRELNLEGSLEELMKELGADSDGRISYNAFSRCRLALRSEIEALRSATPRESYLPTSSDNSLGGKPDTWEFDSGARDLSPEPHTLQRLVEAAAGVNALSTTSTANLLQLANKLHLAALASLRGEILDLSTRLHSVTEERDLLEKTLAETQASIEASSVQHYEERITELHSVIAELTRKIERQRTLVIAEEEDHEQSDKMANPEDPYSAFMDDIDQGEYSQPGTSGTTSDTSLAMITKTHNMVKEMLKMMTNFSDRLAKLEVAVEEIKKRDYSKNVTPTVYSSKNIPRMEDTPVVRFVPAKDNSS